MEDELRELYEALEERERNIDELEAVLTNLEGENDKQQDELDDKTQEVQELQSLIKQLRLDNTSLLEDKTLLADQVSSQKSQLDAQMNLLAASVKASEDTKKIQKDGNQNLYRLELENQRLRDAIIQIEENDDILVNEIETLVRQKSDFQQSSEDLASKCDLLHAELDEKVRTISQLQSEMENALIDGTKRDEEYRKALDDWQRKDAANISENTRLRTELEDERAKHKESALVKENEAFRKELAHVRQENQRLHSIYDLCLVDKNQAERDLDEAIQALNQSKRDTKEQTTSALLKSKSDVTEANAKSDKALVNLESVTKRCLDAEEKLENLRTQLRCSDERNALYEKNNGLTEVVRLQKQLEADVRRRDYDLKQIKTTLGVEIERRRAITKACDWLKEKVGLEPDFSFDDDEVRMALELEDSRLQSENAELSRQIESLEVERTVLLRQLRERAIDLGEKGTRFLGMDTEHVAQVMEFASNLRRGTVELPLNDRSKELLAEISSLKSEIEMGKATLARLEREIATGRSDSSESTVLKQILETVTAENRILRNDIAILKAGGPIDPKSSALTPSMRQRAKEVLGEELVAMPASAEVQIICVLNAYDNLAQEHTLAKGRIAELSKLESALMNLTLERDTLIAQVRKLEDSSATGAQSTVVTQNAAKFNEKKTQETETSSVHEQLIGAQTRTVNGTGDIVNSVSVTQAEMLTMLEQTKQTISRYTNDIKTLRIAVLAAQENGINYAKARKQILCLNEIIREKSRLYDALAARQEGNQKAFTGKRDKRHRVRSADNDNRDHKSDRSISTSSIDSSSLSGRSSHTLNQSMHKRLEESLRIISEKDNMIREQAQKIVDLTQKLLHADEVYQNLTNENEKMKTDISTLVSRASEADTAMKGMAAYQQKCSEMTDALDKVKREVKDLNEKAQQIGIEVVERDSRIKDLLAMDVRSKSILNVARQGRARSEDVVKARNEEIASLKKALEDMTAQMNNLKAEKIAATNEKLKMSQKVRESTLKLKGFTENENSKTVDELTTRIDVLNRTVSGLAAQNSSLRIELAEAKQKMKVESETTATTTTAATTRSSISRERSQALEEKVKSLEKSLAEEKRRYSATTDNSSILEKYQKRIVELETVLEQQQQSTTRNNSSDSSNDDSQRVLLAEQVLSLKSENKSLQQKIEEMNSCIKEVTMHTSKADGKSNHSIEAQLLTKLKAENDVLRKENERLSRIDHLDLFEEIEDLKCKYNDAICQINSLT